MSNTKDEALKLALEALESYKNFTEDAHIIEGQWHWIEGAEQSITAIKQARSAPVQQSRSDVEPVACVIDGDLYFHHEIDWEDLAYQGHGVELLYTTPQPCPTCESLARAVMMDQTAHDTHNAAPAPEERKRQWVGLTNKEIEFLCYADGALRQRTATEMAFAVESKLREKNT